jgi:N-acetylglucosamine kinase
MITCLDIGGSGIKGAVARSASDITMLGRLRTPLDDFDTFVATISEVLALSPAPAGSPVSIAITGVIDPETGIIKCANIPCIDGRRLGSELTSRLGRPVMVANDADCFALAEAVAGAGRGHRIVFGAILGTGVGGGLVIDGKIIVGPGGYAGEWGHGPIAATQVDGIEIPRFACGCGQVGCLDTVGAARGLERLHKHLAGANRNSLEIVEAWKSGDAASVRTMNVYLSIVSDVLALVVNVVGPGIVPVGGGLSKSLELVAALDTEVRKRILRSTNRPLVVPAQLTVEPGLVGAAILGGLS